MALVDTHAHLESARYDDDRELVLERAAEVGVATIITCGSDLETSVASVSLAQRYPGLYAAVGVHGHEAHSAVAPAGTADEGVMARLTALAHEPRVVAIGEIGLDYHYDFSPREVQREVLARQLELASAAGLPVILHNRESDADLRRLVDAAPAELRGVLHCFLAGGEMATWAVERGLYIGVAGPITFRKADDLVEVIREVPPDRLLVETDSPYLAPHPLRGRRNEPAYVVHVARRLAEVRGVSFEEIAALTSENARRLFGVG